MGFRAFYTWAKLASQSRFKGVLRHYFAQGVIPPSCWLTDAYSGVNSKTFFKPSGTSAIMLLPLAKVAGTSETMFLPFGTLSGTPTIMFLPLAKVAGTSETIFSPSGLPSGTPDNIFSYNLTVSQKNYHPLNK